ncbi:hypothetical protein [Romboutsia sp. MSSM.1001216sp_RTP31141st1_G3_RTP31141_220114]|uniref:hypothetical protein n=1 Tax=unclassified Romboutsia TaxID=2626894 RepID=UPI0031B58DD1
MENIVLEFDKRKIEIEEILEHIDYYCNKANEALELYSCKNLKESRLIFKDLRNKLKLEYNYYKKVSISKVIRKSNVYMIYKKEIANAYVKQNRPNSNDNLSSNLYDIYSYMGYARVCISELIN